MQHSQALELEIEALSGQVESVERELHQVESRLLTLLSRVEPDRQSVTELERRKDKLRSERAQIRSLLEHLESQRPSLERSEADERIQRISEEMAVLAANSTQKIDRLTELSQAFLLALEEAFKAPDMAAALRSEAEYLAETCELPLPALPKVPSPDIEGIAALIGEAKMAITTLRHAERQKVRERRRAQR